MIRKILYILLISNIAQAANKIDTSVYSDIPKIVTKQDAVLKEVKIGYNLTNNLAQKQSLFFVEGNLKNSKIDHSSRYQFSEAKTDSTNGVIAHNTTDLFKTNTSIPFYTFLERVQTVKHNIEPINKIIPSLQSLEEKPYFISTILYGRYFNLNDKVQNNNSYKDLLYSVGIGASKANVYNIGLSVGRRHTNQISGDRLIRETIYRPSISYTNKVKNIVPYFIKSTFYKNNIFNFLTMETSVKAEYALVSGHNTRIEQFYIGFDKKIMENLSISIFYDSEISRNTYTAGNVNKIQRFSTSLVLSL